MKKRTDKFCITCGTKLGWSAKYSPERNIKYCQPCSHKDPGWKEAISKTTFKEGSIPWNKGLDGWRSGEESPSWKGGKPECIDCGKQLGAYSAIRCVKCQGKINSGENHPLYKGYPGTTRHFLMQQKEYKDWRNSVFKRDNYTCQMCGKIGQKLNADHIKRWADYPELRFDINNGRTLCQECHKEKTSLEGKRYWINQFSSGVYKVATKLGGN